MPAYYRILNHTKKEYFDLEALRAANGNALSGVGEGLLVSWPFLLLSEPGMDFYLHNFQMEARGALLPPFAEAIRPIKGRWYKGKIGYDTDDNMSNTNKDDSMESLRRNAMHRMLSTYNTTVEFAPISVLEAEDGNRDVGDWSEITHEVIVGLAAYQIAMNVEFVNPFNDGTVADTRGWGLMDMIGTFTPVEALRLFAVETQAQQGTEKERLARYKERRTAPAKAFAAKGAAGTLPKFAQEFYNRYKSQPPVSKKRKA